MPDESPSGERLRSPISGVSRGRDIGWIRAHGAEAAQREIISSRRMRPKIFSYWALLPNKPGNLLTRPENSLQKCPRSDDLSTG
jgi:hypothetical protein